MTTRQEQTNTRDLTFSGWIRKNLPDSSTGFLVSDLDFILFNYQSKEIMLLEVKTRNSQIREWQKILFTNLEKWIKKGIDTDWKFLGFHILKFENTSFIDGKVYLDEVELTEREIINILSFKIKI